MKNLSLNRKSPKMSNEFYTEFDWRMWQGPRSDLYRTAFEVDRDRIIHTSAFRRLQAKTQVFLAGEYDFYRTRLTHSLEVAQIARSICSFLKYSSRFLSDKYHIDSALIEAVGLAHDIGHPPFGHAGERELNILMKPFGGFEGNAQTLRLLTTTIYSAGNSRSGSMRRSGMSPTRAFMDGVMKYKTLQNQMPDAPNRFLYNDQSDCLDFIFDNQKMPAELAAREKLNSFQSIECQIMDWADDTAYRLNDIADGVNAGFIDKSKLERWASSVKLSSQEGTILQRLLNGISKGVLTQNISMKIGRFVEACALEETKNFMSSITNRYRYNLIINDKEVEVEHKLLKRITKELVFSSPQLHQLEYKGQKMLRSLFNVLMENYSNATRASILVPRELDLLLRQTRKESEKARLICDHIAGMSDYFAMRTYRRLYDPNYGSMVDLV